LINPFKRITLSNVYPVIPDNTIIKALHEIGVRTTSAVFPLRTVSSSELFAHVTSFRRQIYINPEDHYKLPGSLVIKQEETSFHIFITDDTLTCFVCNQNGHISSSCSYNTEINLETNKTTQLNSNSPNTHSIHPPLHIIPTVTDTNDPTKMDISTNQNNQVNLNEKANLPIVQIEKPMDTDISSTINEEILINDNYQDIPNSEVIKETNKRPAPSSTCPSSPSAPT